MATPRATRSSTLASAQKRKVAPSSTSKGPPTKRPHGGGSSHIVPVFATRKLADDLGIIMCFGKIHDGPLSGLWKFDLLKHVMEIDQVLQAQQPLKRTYILAGKRDSSMCLLTDLNITPPANDQQANITIPSFTVHVLEQGVPLPAYVFATEDTKDGLNVYKLPIGKNMVSLLFCGGFVAFNRLGVRSSLILSWL